MTYKTLLRRTTVGVAMIAALATTPLSAQESGSSGSGESQTQSPGAAQMIIPDQRVVSVGETEITGADVSEFIESFPPRLRQQPPQMLISMAVQNMVLRELLLQEAEAQNLGEDPEVQSIVEQAADVAREDAMVQVYLVRELEKRVTDEAVQQTYDQIAEQTEEELPPLEDVRLQIVQQLQQQAVQGVQQDLASGVEIVFYGPDGEPMEASADETSADNQ
ncbi:hypothetical protein [Citreimonas salinaria]|uniref:Peptidyl-prolyl cis-trans isomerase SurA n=1 Tax=Citreimonas salinaria TaxID=321339 RepID=A0A1H3NKZ2_9RHOB|nr:hypothetical protein [Citreimonas salinaria]SDY89474.1 hypothetical protein SAMN05444340_1266 [Citreimonas salinaria]